MEVKIFQITDEAFDRINYVFRGWDKAKDEINFKNDYECVYEYKIFTIPSIDYIEGISPREANKILEGIFYEFNQNRPEDFEGHHSLSTSDIVSLDGTLYYCDDFGWREIK